MDPNFGFPLAHTRRKREHKVSKGIITMSDKTEQIHHSEKRFGVIAVQQGMITKDQLLEAWKTQVEDNLEKGIHRLLGEILFQQGAMTWEQIGEVLKALGVIDSVFGPQS